MGTDVYIRDNDNRTVGYIRASIGMVRENSCLRHIFPDEFWDGGIYEYDFISKMIDNLKHIDNYVEGKTDYSDDRVISTQLKMVEAVLELLGVSNNEVEMPTLDSKGEVCWADEVRKALQSGIELQRKGEKVYVHISW